MSDLISRQAAIDTMCELMHHWFGCDSKDEIREIKRELDKLPSVQPKRGEWMPIIEGNEFGESYQTGIYCSECGETLGCEANFCPNCGADMRGEKNE